MASYCPVLSDQWPQRREGKEVRIRQLGHGLDSSAVSLPTCILLFKWRTGQVLYVMAQVMILFSEYAMYSDGFLLNLSFTNWALTRTVTA